MPLALQVDVGAVDLVLAEDRPHRLKVQLLLRHRGGEVDSTLVLLFKLDWRRLFVEPGSADCTQNNTAQTIQQSAKKTQTVTKRQVASKIPDKHARSHASTKPHLVQSKKCKHETTSTIKKSERSKQGETHTGKKKLPNPTTFEFEKRRQR